jgi:hypothetical protein
MRAVLTAAALLLASTGAAVGQERGARQLDRLIGTWQSTGTFVDSAYSKAGPASAKTTCAWSGDGFFLICQQDVVMSGTPEHNVAIYTYDAAAQKYHFYNVGISRANSTDITVSDTAITYSQGFTDGAKHVLTRTLNVWDSPASYSWRAEYSFDGGAHWTLIGSGKTTRTP